MVDNPQPIELRELLNKLRGLSFDSQARDQIIARMKSLGVDRLFPVLSKWLADPDAELRCLVAETLFRIDRSASVPLLLPMLEDPEWIVRVEACGLLHDIADQRALEPLTQRLKTDPHPMVRNTAAYALGGIGSPAAIPALVEAMESDHEYDEMGHSTSGCAATALDNILSTHDTRIALADGLCTMQPLPFDPDALKAKAMAFYHSLG